MPSVVHVITTAEVRRRRAVRDARSRARPPPAAGTPPSSAETRRGCPAALGAGRPLATRRDALTRSCGHSLALGRQDVCHAHMTLAEAAALAARPFHRAPVITTRHFGAPRGSSRAGRLAARWIAPRLAREIAVSDFVARRLERPPDAVIRNGVSSAPLLWQPREPRRPRAPASPAREGHCDGAAGMAASQDSPARGWPLRIVGDGAERAALERLAAKREPERVDSPAGSATWRAEFARAGMLLAAAPGRTVRPFRRRGDGRRRPGCRECGRWPPRDGRSACAEPRLFPPGDAAAAAAALRSLLADAARARASGAGRRLVARLVHHRRATSTHSLARRWRCDRRREAALGAAAEARAVSHARVELSGWQDPVLARRQKSATTTFAGF